MEKRKGGWLRLGIRQKVILVLSVVLFATLTLAGYLLISKEKRDFLQGITQRGDDISGYVAKSLAFSVIGYDYHTIQLLLDEVTSSDEVAHVEVRNAQGKVMGTAGALLGPSEMRLFQQPIVLNEQVIGELRLALNIRESLEAFSERTRELLWWELAVTLVVVLGEFVALSLVIIRPVREITGAIERMSEGDAEPLAEIASSSHDEFGLMAQRFNELSRRLRESHRRLQSKVDLADRQLVEKNRQLLRQSAELSRINNELRELSLTDELTRLYNRRHFHEHLAKELAMVRRYGDAASLILVDLDHFKRVNDTWGHVVGDGVLRSFAERLRGQVRDSDVLCRIGGEEFALLCKKTDGKKALELAEKLRSCTESEPLAVGDLRIPVTISLGVATLPDGASETTERILYSRADHALYWSKTHGRNLSTHCRDIVDEQDDAAKTHLA